MLMKYIIKTTMKRDNNMVTYRKSPVSQMSIFNFWNYQNKEFIKRKTEISYHVTTKTRFITKIAKKEGIQKEISLLIPEWDIINTNSELCLSVWLFGLTSTIEAFHLYKGHSKSNA